jgi:hypothetical protein
MNPIQNLLIVYKPILLILFNFWFVTACESQYVTEEDFKVPSFIIYCDYELNDFSYDMEVLEFDSMIINPNYNK